MTGTDVDSLYILPLADMPIEIKALREARLVKNARLEGMVELFQERGSGSGHLPPDGLADFFDFSGERCQDFILINKLCALPSYDVYSLRVSLREIGVDISAMNALKLSDQKTAELASYMNEFTRPLVKFVYGDNGRAPAGLSELMRMFSDPDASVARENLARLAQQLDVDLERIPRFLEDYADVYMSLSFYRQCLEGLAPNLTNFLKGLHAIRTSSYFRDERRLIADCNAVERKLSELYTNIAGILDEFRETTETMWDDPNADSYRETEEMIINLQAHIGEVLCALTVKLLAWQSKFRSDGGEGRLAAKAAFVVSEMKYGLDSIRPLSQCIEEPDATSPNEAAA